MGVSWKLSRQLLISVILSSLLLSDYSLGARVELEGPSLIVGPSPVTFFSNTVGVTLTCLGKGHAPIVTNWLSPNGDNLPQIPGLRESLQNGSLSFGSFRVDEYTPDIHNGQFRCSVTNPVGTFLSPIFSVRSVVESTFDLYITGFEEGDVIEGNPVVLQCHISPSGFSDFIQVITWKSVDQFGYQTEIQSDGASGRGFPLILPGARLVSYYISRVHTTRVEVYDLTPGSVSEKVSNHFERISCHLLSQIPTTALRLCGSECAQQEDSIKPTVLGQIDKRYKTEGTIHTNSSTSGSSSGGLPPKSSGRWEQMTLTEMGKSVDLVCPAVGNPPPNFRWEKLLPGGVRVPVVTGGGIEVHGPVLCLNRAEKQHNGTYQCSASNSVGAITLDRHLILTSPPVLTIEPKRKLLLRVGQSVDLTCKVSPNLYQNVEVTWYKNGKLIYGLGSRIKISFQKVVIFNAQLDDQGVYQCFAQIEGDNIQASTEIVFEAVAPEIQHTFIAQSLQPGPSVSLKCSASGNPLPEIRWDVDGQELLPSPKDDTLEARYWQLSDRYSIGSFRQFTEIVSHINISSVRVEDGGSYRCTVSNLLGSLSHSARLNIYGPLFVKEMPNLTLVAQTTVHINCGFGGFPVSNITWHRNSRDLSNLKESRFTTLPNGTLRVEKITTETDKGTYTCRISNRKGEVASGSVEVNVMHPPVISAFVFDDNLVQGQRASASCNVMSGDLPIDIVWLKDFQHIPGFLNITEMRVKFLSNLIFEELKSVHTGTYTCSVSNAAATANHSAVLSVKVPPFWIQEPVDAKVILRTSHIIRCIADGVPKPIVKWFRDTGLMKLPVQSDRKFEVLDDGSLKLDDVEAMDGSNYSCEWSNGVGTGIAKSIRLHVNIPAKVSAPMTSVVVAEGLAALLKCQIRGDRPIQVEWRRNAIVMTEQSPRLLLQEVLDVNSSLLSAELRIEKSERSDSGLYVCGGSNEYGRDEDRISLEVKARPAPPEDFIVEEIGSRFIRLKWSLGPQTSSSAPVTYFILQFKKSSSLSWLDEGWNTSIQAPSTHAVLEPLNPVTNYDIRIFSSNEIGHSFPSEPLAVLTLPEAPSGPPLNISAIPVTSKSVLVRWDAPNPFLQHGAILGYHIFASLQQNHPGFNNTVVMDEKWSQHAELHGLRPNSQYRISIRGYNSAGMGPESPFVAVHTPEGAPDASPVNIRCSALSPKSLQVEYDPPPIHLSNGQIQGYKIYFQSVANEKRGERGEVKKTSYRETTLHGLQSFTNYSIRTLAFTQGGEGVVSEPHFCLTEEDVPEEPADIKVLPMTPTSVLVSWLTPRHPNGIITKYTVYWKSEERAKESVKEKSFTPTMGMGMGMEGGDEEQMSLEIGRLRENHKYVFWITAATGHGSGKPSKLQSVLLTPQVDGRIASFAVTRNVILNQPVMLPCKTTGTPAPKVSWIKKSHVETSYHLMRNGSLFIARVKDADEGGYTCRAENPSGFDEIQHQIIISRPPSSLPIFLGYVSASSVQIHWEGPHRADPPVTGFVIYYQRDNKLEEWEKKRLTSKMTSVTLDSLSCGIGYHFKIAAENVIGLGQFSSILKAKTNGNKPDMPKLTDILEGNDTVIHIDLTKWPDGGCLISTFQIEYKTIGKQKDTNSNWQRIYRRDNETRIFVFHAIPKMNYDVRFIVENDAGSIEKIFRIEANSEFFTNYDKLMKESTAEERSTGLPISVYVVVPIVSAVISICAIALCVLIILKRRAMAKQQQWKFAHSTSQQTWISSEESHAGSGKADTSSNVQDSSGGGGGGNMSIYATLNSTNPIPMAIRDSTVRFQTFGQRDNYDAPTMPSNYKKNRRKSNPTSSPPGGPLNLEVSCISNQKDFGGHPDSRNFRYYEQNSDSDDTGDSLYPNYARPYQLTAHRRKDVEDKGGGRNTLKKKHTEAATRNRGSREYLE